MIETDNDIMQWQSYTGDVLGIIATALLSMGGQKPELPLYSEIAYPVDKPKADTVEDARKHVYEMFGINPDYTTGGGDT